MLIRILFISSGTSLSKSIEAMKCRYPRWDTFHMMAFGYGLENILSRYPIIIIDNDREFFNTEAITRHVKSPRTKVIVVSYGTVPETRNRNVTYVSAAKGGICVCDLIDSEIRSQSLTHKFNVIRFPGRKYESYRCQ